MYDNGKITTLCFVWDDITKIALHVLCQLEVCNNYKGQYLTNVIMNAVLVSNLLLKAKHSKNG